MTETYKGHWWLPDDPTEAYPGILTCEPHGDVHLELIGGFSVETRTRLPDGRIGIGMDGNWPIIHGASGGTPFTLVATNAAHTRGGLGTAVGEQTITAIRALKGLHLASVDEPVFAGMELEIEYLLGWAARTTIEASIEFEGGWNGKQTFRTAPADEQTAQCEDLTFTLRVPHEQFQIDTAFAGNQRSITNREFAALDVASASPRSLRDLDTTAKALQDLLTFVAVAPAGVLRRTLWLSVTDDEFGPQAISLFGRQIFAPGSDSGDDKRFHNYLFTLDQVEFAQVVPAWLKLHRAAWLPLSMFFGTKYARAPYASLNLMSVAAAAEGLHRCLHDHVPLDADTFETSKETLLAAIPGPANAPIRKLVHQQLHNTLTFRARLLELVAQIDQSAVEDLLVNTDAWLTRLTKARNGTAHADDTRPGSRPEGSIIFWLAEITYYFLSLILLAELQIDAEFQQALIKLPKVSYAISEFKDIVSTSKKHDA